MDVERRACKACDTPLAIVRDAATGRVLYLDERALTYTIEFDAAGNAIAKPATAFVSHTSTCPRYAKR